MISRNKKVYKLEVKKLLSKYFQKYSKAGKLPFEEETLGLAEEEEDIDLPRYPERPHWA